MLKLLEEKIFCTSTSSGRYAGRSFRSAGPGGSAVKAVLPAGGADSDHSSDFTNRYFQLIQSLLSNPSDVH
jgi:hypothetical protein